MSSQPSGLRINREERRFLGVCAGIADYLDLPVALVRIIFVISMLTWPTLIIAYFVLYFWLDRNLSADKVYDFLSGSPSARHFRNLDYRRPLYRNMRNRRIAGVCSGLADYLEVKVFWVRCITVIATFLFGPYALLAYAIGWFVMEPDPAPRYRDRAQSKEQRRRRRLERRMERHQRKAERYARRFRQAAGESVASSPRDRGPSDDSLQPLYDHQDVASTPGPDQQGKSTQMGGRETAGLGAAHESLETCADTYYALESRMRELEAYITSKKFRLHCELNRI